MATKKQIRDNLTPPEAKLAKLKNTRNDFGLPDPDSQEGKELKEKIARNRAMVLSDKTVPELASSLPSSKANKHAGGRPKKGDEPTSVRSFRLPDRTVKRLRVLAALRGVSAADIIVALADKETVPGID